jgi:FtsZ-binding cell division protein ZapB
MTALDNVRALQAEVAQLKYERDCWTALAAAADADKRKAEAIAAEQAGKLERMRALLLNAYCYVVAHVPIGVKTDKDRGVLMLDIDAALKEQK